MKMMKWWCVVVMAAGLFGVTAQAQVIYSNDFSGFAGTGFAPEPVAGQLDSDEWKLTGMSDGDTTFGGTFVSGDYARGSSLGGVSTGGAYGFDVGGGNASIGIQQGGSDFTPGSLVLRIQNNTGGPVTDLDIVYTIHAYNDQGRSSSFNFSHSADDATFNDVPELNFTTPELADAPASWVSLTQTARVSGIIINDGAYYYLRWLGDDATGSGSRDEFALDDVLVTAVSSGNTDLFVGLSQVDGFTLIEGTGESVIATAINGSGGYVFEWTTSMSSNDYSAVSNIFTILETAAPGAYTSTVTVTDSSLVSTSASVSFSIIANYSITVEPNPNGSITTLSNATAGTTVFVNATPNSGYILVSIGVLGQDLTPVTLTGNSFIMPSQPVVVSAVFEEFAFPGGELLISEVVDPVDNTSGRYVELYNPTADPVDLGAGLWHIVRQANGSPLSVSSEPLTGVVQPGGTFVIAGSSSGFTNAYGFAADDVAGILTGNGDDGYFLYHSGDAVSGVLLDAYGVPDVDGTGQPWEYTDSRAVRNASVTNANTTWTAIEWAITAAGVADATPGVHPETSSPPLNPSLQDISIFTLSGGIASISIGGSESGFSYVLTSSDTLGNTNPWTLVDGPLAGNDAALGPFEDVAATNSSRFYRIELAPAP